MKKTRLILLLATIAVCVLAVALFAGCKVGIVYDYDHLVTFDYNVDNLGVPTNCPTQYLGVMDGDKIIAPSTEQNAPFKGYTVIGFYNEGWYTAVLDNDGNPVKDDKGNVRLDRKWDFDNDVVRGDITLYAKFVCNTTLTIVVDDDTKIEVVRQPGSVYSGPTSSQRPSKDGYTFINYYKDENYTERFTFPYVFTNDDVTCYALMVEGTWSVVTNVDTFKTALANGSNMYFDVPSGTLDFNRQLLTSQYNKGFNGKIYGNGCVLKNITLDVSYSRGSDTYSLLGNIGAAAEIKDLTIENMTFGFTFNTLATPDTKAALFATKIEAGAKLDNIKFVNCALNYKGVSNFPIEKYGYYVESAASYSCFDDSQLSVTDNVIVNASSSN